MNLGNTPVEIITIIGSKPVEIITNLSNKPAEIIMNLCKKLVLTATNCGNMTHIYLRPFDAVILSPITALK